MFSKLLVLDVLVSLASVSFVSYVSSYTSSGNYKCLDSYGCQDDTIKNDGNIYCYGNYGCDSADMTSSNVIHCGGNYGCTNATMNATSEVRCQGKYACHKADINYAGNKLYVYGVEGASHATLSNSNYTYCYGFYACRYASMSNIKTIYGSGLYGMAYATIDSDNIDNLDIYSLGTHSGYSTSIYCRDGSTCDLECGNYYGCSSDTVMYCYDGATCEYSCGDCNTDVCPTVYNESDFTALNSKFTFDEFVTYNELQRNAKRDFTIKKLNKYVKKYGMDEGHLLFNTWFQDYVENEMKINEKTTIKNNNKKMMASSLSVAPVISNNNGSGRRHGPTTYDVVSMAVGAAVMLLVVGVLKISQFLLKGTEKGTGYRRIH